MALAPAPPTQFTQLVGAGEWSVVFPDGTWLKVIGFGLLTTGGTAAPMVVHPFDGQTIVDASVIDPKYRLIHPNMSG